MHRVLSLLTRLGLFATPALAEPPDHAVRIRVAGVGLARGTLVDATGLVITAAHLIPCDARIRVQVPGSARWRPAEVVALNDAADLAVVKFGVTGRDELAVAGISVGLPETGAAVHAWGGQGRVDGVVGNAWAGAVDGTLALDWGDRGAGVLDEHDSLVAVAGFQPWKDQTGDFSGMGPAVLRRLLERARHDELGRSCERAVEAGLRADAFLVLLAEDRNRRHDFEGADLLAREWSLHSRARRQEWNNALARSLLGQGRGGAAMDLLSSGPKGSDAAVGNALFLEAHALSLVGLDGQALQAAEAALRMLPSWKDAQDLHRLLRSGQVILSIVDGEIEFGYRGP